MTGFDPPLRLCWVEDDEDEVVKTSLDKLTMILTVQVGHKAVCVDLRGILHASKAIHCVTRHGELVLRTSKDGAFSGLIHELKMNNYTTVSEAVVTRAIRLSDKREEKRKRDDENTMKMYELS
jgi:hypothetical protein